MNSEQADNVYNSAFKHIQNYTLTYDKLTTTKTMQFHQRLQKRIQEHGGGTCNIGGNTIVNTKPAFKVKTYFKPTEHNVWLWSFYILQNGLDEYKQMKRDFSEERTQRFELIHVMEGIKKEDFKKLGRLTKFNKLDCINDIGNSDKMSIKSFIALCMVHKINIVLKNNIFGQLFCFDETKDEYYEINVVDENFGMKTKTRNECENKYIMCKNIDKPLLGIGTYRLPQLQSIATKLQIPLLKKTKQILYQEILAMM